MLEWAFFSYLYQRDHLQQVLMTYGLILVFEELRALLVGNDVHGVPVPPWLSRQLRARRPDELPVCTGSSPRPPASCSRSALYCVVHRTRLGMMIRAGASNRDMVRGAGHRHPPALPHRVRGRRGARGAGRHDRGADVLGLSRAWARSVLIICFVVVVIGGIGSITGALVASLLVGLRRHLRQGASSPSCSGIGVYVLMAIILIWRPEGLMGRKT